MSDRDGNYTKMKDTQIYIVDCTKCGTKIERELDNAYGTLRTTDFQIYFNMLIRTNPEKDLIAKYLKRHAEFCKPECMIEYCNDMKIEDLNLEPDTRESFVFEREGKATWFPASQSMIIHDDKSSCVIPQQIAADPKFPIGDLKGKRLKLTIKVEEV